MRTGHGERPLVYHGRRPRYFRHGGYEGAQAVGRGECLSGRRLDAQVGVKASHLPFRKACKAVEHAQYHHNGHYRYGHTAHSHAAYDIDGGMAFARVQVASGYFKGLQEGRHCAGSGSFLEQMVDVLYIVQGIVEHECQFRGLAQLEAYPLGELVAHGSGAGVDAFEHGRAFVAGEYG